MVGPTRDNIHATVGSMTWNPHHWANAQAGSIFYRQQVQSVQTLINVFIERSQRDLPMPPFSLRVLPPLFRTKTSQKLFSFNKKIGT